MPQVSGQVRGLGLQVNSQFELQVCDPDLPDLLLTPSTIHIVVPSFLPSLCLSMYPQFPILTSDSTQCYYVGWTNVVITMWYIVIASAYSSGIKAQGICSYTSGILMERSRWSMSNWLGAKVLLVLINQENGFVLLTRVYITRARVWHSGILYLLPYYYSFV